MKMNIIVKRIALASALLVVASVFISGVISLFVVKEMLAEKSAAMLARILISVLVCVICYYHSVKAGKNRMQISLGIGALYLGLSLTTGLLIAPKSELKIDIWVAVVIMMAVIAGIVSGTKRERRR